MRVWLVVGALVASSSTALAAPKGKDAKAAWDRGVAAYQKGDYAGASDALGQSYKLEPDVETLYAWAQSERQQNKCESAIDLYKKLLDTDIPAENKEAVQTKLDECKAIVAAKTGVLDKPLDTPPKDDKPVEQPIAPPAERPSGGGTPWWKDTIGDALTVGGVVGLGVGAYFLYSASQAEQRSKDSFADFESEQDKAESRGRIGVIATVAGGAMLVGGIVRYVTRPSGKSEPTVSAWVTPDAGGITAFGRF